MKKLFNQTGDTIVEVMVATTILALVLGVSFVTANRSLSTGTDAANRKQALQYAQAQIDLLRVIINNGTLKTGTTNNIPASEFCVGVDSQTQAYNVLPAHSCDQGQFQTGVSYSTSNQSFAITTQWPSSRGSTPNTLTLYYQDPE